jgi:hypothetical protein
MLIAIETLNNCIYSCIKMNLDVDNDSNDEL